MVWCYMGVGGLVRVWVFVGFLRLVIRGII